MLQIITFSERSEAMSFHKMLPPLFLLLAVILAAPAATPTTDHGLSGCPHSCGNLTIPYPFGTRKGCYLDESFFITCDEYSNRPFLGTKPVLDISLNGELKVSSPVAYDCSDKSVRPGNRGPSWMKLFNYSISSTRNKFMAIGCNTNAYLTPFVEHKYLTNCMSLCVAKDDAKNGTCSGIACCQTPLPQGVSDFNLSVTNDHMMELNNTTDHMSMNHTHDHMSMNHTHESMLGFSPCSFAFVVEDGVYNFSKFDLYNLSNIEEFPMVLDWAIRDTTCEKACGNNSKCYNLDNISGYRCNCSDGYEGNPYLPTGCEDINECLSPELNTCTDVSSKNVCHNTDGGFFCPCPKGYHGDGRRDGKGCVANEIWQLLIVPVGIGIAVSVLVLIAIGLWLYRTLDKRQKNKMEQKLFKRNGGLLLQQQISSSNESVGQTKVFKAKELEKATDNFNESRVLGKGGLGTVYKGMLSDGSIVAIKKSNIVDENQISQFINEVIILSRINHRNIVKLLGCCLETEVPLLVYEYISNGTLSHHLHDEGHASTMSWNTRLRIAGEIAGALSYLHSYASTSIFHRDIKSSNILVDENYKAVVSDFGLSRSVPLNKTHLTTLVGGTFGYLDPEYFRSGQLTDKSDVYAFGVVLAELLTGKKAVSSDRSDEGLVLNFRSSMKQNCLFEIIETVVVNDGKKEEIQTLATLAKRCLKLRARKRPSMKEIAAGLDQLRGIQEQPLLEQNSLDNYCWVSEGSDSYTTEAVEEEC